MSCNIRHDTLTCKFCPDCGINVGIQKYMNETMLRIINNPVVNSGRANLLRWVLERSPYIHASKITPFVQLFEAMEDSFISDPDKLLKFMCDYFTPSAGKIAFNQFKDMLMLYLSPPVSLETKTKLVDEQESKLKEEEDEKRYQEFKLKSDAGIRRVARTAEIEARIKILEEKVDSLKK